MSVCTRRGEGEVTAEEIYIQKSKSPPGCALEPVKNFPSNRKKKDHKGN